MIENRTVTTPMNTHRPTFALGRGNPPVKGPPPLPSSVARRLRLDRPRPGPEPPPGVLLPRMTWRLRLTPLGALPLMAVAGGGHDRLEVLWQEVLISARHAVIVGPAIDRGKLGA